MVDGRRRREKFIKNENLLSFFFCLYCQRCRPSSTKIIYTKTDLFVNTVHHSVSRRCEFCTNVLTDFFFAWIEKVRQIFASLVLSMNRCQMLLPHRSSLVSHRSVFVGIACLLRDYFALYIFSRSSWLRWIRSKLSTWVHVRDKGKLINSPFSVSVEWRLILLLSE